MHRISCALPWLLEEVSLLVDIENFVDESDDYHMFDESPKSEVPKLGIEKINFVDNFLPNSPYQNFDVWFPYVGGQFEF